MQCAMQCNEFRQCLSEAINIPYFLCRKPRRLKAVILSSIELVAQVNSFKPARSNLQVKTCPSSKSPRSQEENMDSVDGLPCLSRSYSADIPLAVQ